MQSLAFLDAYVYGFVLQEVHLPTDPGPIIDVVRAHRSGSAAHPHDTRGAPEATLPAYPNLEAVITGVIGEAYRFGDDFELGLDLMIEGLAHLRRGGRAPRDADRTKPSPR